MLLRILRLIGLLIAAPIMSVLRGAEEELPYAGFTLPVYVGITWAMATISLVAPRFVAATEETSMAFTTVMFVLALAAMLSAATIAVILGLAARTWMCGVSDAGARASAILFLTLLISPAVIIIATWPF